MPFITGRIPALLWALCCGGANAASSCSARGCNFPTFFSDMTMAAAGDSIVYGKSANFDSATELAVKAGIDVAVNFLGQVSPVYVFLFEPGGTDQDYATLMDEACAWTEDHGGDCDGLKGAKSNAQNGGGQYYASGISNCQTCSDVEKENVLTGVSLYFLPTDSDVASPGFLSGLAVHEYTHAFQKAAGGSPPSWLMEGGAVLNQCALGLATGLWSSFAGCLTHGGGGGGIVPNTRALYQSSPGTTFLASYGEDWCCGGNCPATPGFDPDYAPAGVPSFRLLYYDVGAVAILFAVERANANHVGDGGRTLVDFWSSPGSAGFWHAIDPHPISYTADWPSDVPEGKGWRKALSDFTGYADTAAFYADFEAYMATAPSQAAMLARFAPDDSAMALCSGAAYAAPADAALWPHVAKSPPGECETFVGSDFLFGLSERRVILGAVALVVLVCACVLACHCYCKAKKKPTSQPAAAEGASETEMKGLGGLTPPAALSTHADAPVSEA